MKGYNKYVGARYVPIFDGEWDKNKSYEPLVIVSYVGNSYTSKTFVPIGADINDTKYWANTGNYNAQVEYYRQEVADLSNTVATCAKKTYKDIYVEDVHKDITDMKTKIETILEEETGAINLIFTKDFSISPIVIDRTDIKFTGDVYVTSVDNENTTFSINGKSYNSVNCTISNNKVICDNSSFSAGDIVVFSGTNGFVSMITAIESDGFLICDTPIFNVSGITSVKKCNKSNVIFDGLSFKGNAKYTIGCNSPFITIKNCNFENTNGIDFTNGYCVIDSCNFNDCYVSVLLYEASHGVVKNCSMTHCTQGVRCVNSYSNNIYNNIIQNGNNKSYGIGIELTTEHSSEKSCENGIINNKVINANLGVLGSGIGGIHLNFNSHHNMIANNTSNGNSFGICLENANCYNIIANNICNDNIGWYGVGIELDWDNHYNVITGNTCCHNIANITKDGTVSHESSGIIIRASYNDGHANMGNIISENTVSYNGHCGIICGSKETIISNNTLKLNGADRVNYTKHAEIRIKGASDTIVISNNVNSNLVNTGCIEIVDSMRIKIKDNILVALGSDNSVIDVQTSDYIKISENNITGSPKKRGIAITGTSESALNNISVINNILNYPKTGYNIIEFTYINNYSSYSNLYNGDIISGSFIKCTGSMQNDILKKACECPKTGTNTFTVENINNYRFIGITITRGTLIIFSFIIPSSDFKVDGSIKYEIPIKLEENSSNIEISFTNATTMEVKSSQLSNYWVHLRLFN